MDGTLVPWAEATVHVLSHSLQRGSLVFDYMSVHETPKGPAVFRMGEHLDRFRHSCELVGLALDRKPGELGAAVAETVRANPGATAVKVSAFLPSVEIDVVPMDTRVAVAIAAYDPIRDVLAKKSGKPPFKPELSVWIEKVRRNRREDIVPAQAKVAANYLSTMTAKASARRRGYDEILLLDEEGLLAEGPTTNLFLVDGEGTLRTPPERRILLGVTRRSVLDIAKHDGLPVAETPMRPVDLFAAREAFLTGTTAGVWPIVSADGRRIGEGRTGPVTERLRERFAEVVSGRDPDFESWLHYVAE